MLALSSFNLLLADLPPMSSYLPKLSHEMKGRFLFGCFKWSTGVIVQNFKHLLQCIVMLIAEQPSVSYLSLQFVPHGLRRISAWTGSGWAVWTKALPLSLCCLLGTVVSAQLIHNCTICSRLTLPPNSPPCIAVIARCDCFRRMHATRQADF